MRRREFISLVGSVAGASLLPSFAANSQQMPVVGLLSGRSAGESRRLLEAFLKGLSEAGYEQGRNVALELKWADNQYDRLPVQAAELVRRPVALIVAVGAIPAIRAAKAATSTIPIVSITGDDPVRLGLVQSLNRPGGNMTGITPLATQLEAKRLEIVHQLLPKAAAIAQIVNPNSPSAEGQIVQTEEAARSLSRPFQALKATTVAEIDAAYAAAVQRGAGAIMIAGDPFLNSRREQIIGLAARHKLPTFFSVREATEEGGLMSYGASIPDSYRQAGVYAGRILKGEKPADLPVMQAAKFEFVINLKTAKALGLEIPDRLMALADDVIE